MKKSLLFLLGILFSAMCSAQLQNGSFETWNNVSFSDPIPWFTSNGEAIQKNIGANVNQFTPAYAGNYAVKIKTKASATDTVFGFISNSQNPLSGKGGTPYTQSPDSVIFHGQLGVGAGDSALLIVVFKKLGSPIGMNIIKISGNNPGVWQRLAYKLGTLAVAPDSVIVAMASSNAATGIGIQIGSNLVIDNLSFNTSQPIPGGDFENWHATNMEYPATYPNANIQWILAGLTPPLIKTTDAHDGMYALQMKTQSNGSGMVFAGINNANWNPAIMDYSGGFGYTKQVDTLIGWYKYTPKNAGGIAALNINFQNSDATFQTVSTQLPLATTYTKFTLPFSLSQVPDTAIITINTSQTPVNLADTGSTLIIDALQFASAPLGVQQFISPTDAMIGPNPSQGQFSLYYVAKNLGKATYAITDETGKTIKTELLNRYSTSIDLVGYPKGIYLVNISDGNIRFTKKIILQ